MYPRPIQRASIVGRTSYRVVLIASLVVWLLPLLAILLTSVRSLADINSGNYWTIPNEIALVQNYSEVFTRSPMLRYFLNSIIVTVPATVIAVLISSMAGYSLAMHRFRGRVCAVCHVYCRKFHSLSGADDSGAPVDHSVGHLQYAICAHRFSRCLSVRILHLFPAQFHRRVAVLTGRVGAYRWRPRMANLL